MVGAAAEGHTANHTIAAIRPRIEKHENHFLVVDVMSNIASPFESAFNAEFRERSCLSQKLETALECSQPLLGGRSSYGVTAHAVLLSAKLVGLAFVPLQVPLKPTLTVPPLAIAAFQ